MSVTSWKQRLPTTQSRTPMTDKNWCTAALKLMKEARCG